MKSYVGVSGFMSRSEVDAALEALPAGLTLMVGVLASEKATFGAGNKYPLRYPKASDIAGIFSPDARCLNLLHWSSAETPDAALVSRLQTIGGPRCNGFQFNGAYPSPSTLAALAGGTVVLQVRPGKTLTAEWSSAAHALRNCDVHILIDGSGGRGVPMDGDVFDAWAMTIAGWFGSDVGIAFAGGLDADHLPRIASEVRTWCASIDAEGRLRDGDEGGTLNLDKVRAYLAAAGELIGGRS